MKQFELRWATLPAPVGRRPVLLLSRSAAFEYLSKVIVAEITTTIRNIPQEVSLGRSDGLDRASVVNLDNVHVIPLAWIGDAIGTVSREQRQAVKRALGFALDWPELKLL